MFDVATADFGTLTFDVQSISAPLANPTPSFFVADRFDAADPVRVATKVSVDNSAIWLLDANDDFLNGYGPASHWTDGTGFQLSWSHVPGAVRYKIYGRNTSSPNGANVDALQWQALNAVVSAPVDPNLQASILATGVMQNQFSLFGRSGPFSYGNGVEIAVTSVDRNGFESPIDPTKTLTLKDTTVPWLSGADLDAHHAAPGQLAQTVEIGSSFSRVVDVTFSEAMDTSQTPTFEANSGNLTVVGTSFTSWNANDPTAPSQDSATVSAKVALKSRGVCTELMVARQVGQAGAPIATGDAVLPVRDASYFTAGASQSLLLVSTSGAPVLFQVDGIQAVDGATNMVTLSSPMTSTAALPIPKGALVCSLAASPGNATTLVSAASAPDAVVGDSSIFHVGEFLIVVRPGPGTTVAVAGVMVIGNDTVANTLRTMPSIDSATFPAGSLVFPMPMAGEYAFRPEQDLALFADVLTGGAATDLEFTPAFPNLMAPVMVGDQLFLDRDGNLSTTADQAVVAVKQVRIVQNDPTWGNRVRLNVDLPENVLPLLHTANPKVTALGDSIKVSGVADTSGTSASRALNPRQEIISGSGLIR